MQPLRYGRETTANDSITTYTSMTNTDTAAAHFFVAWVALCLCGGVVLVPLFMLSLRS